MYVVTDRSVANASGDTAQRERLLGFAHIDGVCFVSHVAGEVRPFNGNRSDTSDIESSLRTRYHLACSVGEVSALEKDGMESMIEIHWQHARRIGESKLLVRPLELEFCYTLEHMQHDVLEDLVALIPPNGFPILDNTSFVPAVQPEGFRLPLKPEQLRSLAWMLSR